jgi:glucosamine-6-phosphate deaminase
MMLKVIKAKDNADLSDKACAWIAGKLKELPSPVLGLATGSTPEGLYQRLAEKYRQGEISFHNVQTFNLDEYVGLSEDNPNSYHYYMNEKLFKHIDLPGKQTHLPNGLAADLEQECRNYEQLITAAGHIDLQLLGLGMNGHIGFNEPGAPFSGKTHIAALDTSTRHANARYFASEADVPTQAISMGIKTIMESREILLLASGENKADAVERLIHGDISERFPASVLKSHQRVTVIADEAAMSKVEIASAGKA